MPGAKKLKNISYFSPDPAEGNPKKVACLGVHVLKKVKTHDAPRILASASYIPGKQGGA